MEEYQTVVNALQNGGHCVKKSVKQKLPKLWRARRFNQSEWLIWNLERG